MRRVPEWDAEKAAANLRKHGFDFADAVTALMRSRCPTMTPTKTGS
jgi:uncharacterized DUF497 family protein